ncbi:unnamed protein product, partial [Meganyctiphanes norvegica]
GIRSSRLWISANGEENIYYPPVEADLWYQICFGYSLTSNEVTATVNGEESSSRITLQNSMSNNTDQKICLGSNEDISSFVGDIALFYVTLNTNETELEEADMSSPSCNSSIPEEAILVQDELWQTYGNAKVEQFVGDLCQNTSQIIVLNISDFRFNQLEMCKQLGGKPLQIDDIQKLYDKDISEIRSCTAINNHISWIDDTSFVENNENIETLCKTVMTNFSLGYKICISDLNCIICSASRSREISLYGDIQYFDRKFSLFRDIGSMPYLAGATSKIEQVGKVWVLSSFEHRQTFNLKGSALPYGRKTWTSGTMSKTLTLTKCSSSEYSCDNGECIPFNQRCDSQSDCQDKSDEVECIKVFSKAGYSKENTPLLDEDDNVYLKMLMGIFAIEPITTEKGEGSVDSWMAINWTEPRIYLKHLYDDVSQIDCNNIWYPKPNLVAGYENMGYEYEMNNYKTTCWVYQSENTTTEADITDHRM